jgi:carbamoyltransferase
MTTALMLTLGHNSSAVYFDGNKALGYEEERLNRIKSSSSYPYMAIAEIEKRLKIEPGSYVFISHWFDDFDFTKKSNKYFDKEAFDILVEKYSLKNVVLSENFTHHDAHAWSALSFLKDKWNSKHDQKIDRGDKLHIVAADGFGNSQEVISIYETSVEDLSSRPKLVGRYHGFDYSLGLMYQYATSFCGMKENQDEYKFLGYESHVSDVLEVNSLQALRAMAGQKVVSMFESMKNSPDCRNSGWDNHDGLINVPSLMETKKSWYKHFEEVVAAISPGLQGRDVRIVVGHYIQQVIEGVMLKIVEHYNMKHVALSGGIFYNVKLNNQVLTNTTGLFSVVPLAGDQGCGIGMFEAYVGDFKWGDLKWGDRPAFKDWSSTISKQDIAKYGEHIRYYSFADREKAVLDTVSALRTNKLVNVVKSKMEFGPRALCSTTTLAVPTTSNVEIINDINERDTVMPMAPVMLHNVVQNFFDTRYSDRVIGSDRFMILTYDYVSPDLKGYGGTAHKYPDREVWSGRPQIIDPNDTFMTEVLNGVSDFSKALINTSFNAHGRPIVYDLDSVLDSFKFEFDKSLELGHELPLLHLCDFDG